MNQRIAAALEALACGEVGTNVNWRQAAGAFPAEFRGGMTKTAGFRMPAMRASKMVPPLALAGAGTAATAGGIGMTHFATNAQNEGNARPVGGREIFDMMQRGSDRRRAPGASRSDSIIDNLAKLDKARPGALRDPRGFQGRDLSKLRDDADYFSKNMRDYPHWHRADRAKLPPAGDNSQEDSLRTVIALRELLKQQDAQ